MSWNDGMMEWWNDGILPTTSIPVYSIPGAYPIHIHLQGNILETCNSNILILLHDAWYSTVGVEVVINLSKCPILNEEDSWNS